MTPKCLKQLIRPTLFLKFKSVKKLVCTTSIIINEWYPRVLHPLDDFTINCDTAKNVSIILKC